MEKWCTPYLENGTKQCFKGSHRLPRVSGEQVSEESLEVSVTLSCTASVKAHNWPEHDIRAASFYVCLCLDPMPVDQEQYYGFTQFAVELNELDLALRPLLPPSDTRFRPDQRLPLFVSHSCVHTVTLRISVCFLSPDYNKQQKQMVLYNR